MLALALSLPVLPSVAFAQDSAPEHFTVDSIDVVGATVLSADEIEGIVYRFTGENKTGADLEEARKALQDAYSKRGYEAVVVDLPQQDPQALAAGVARINVMEAPVGQVRVAGAKFHSADKVRGQLPSVVPGKPLNLAALQKQLVEANRIPDRTVMPAFKPSPKDGTIDVDLKVKDQIPFHTSVELNNDNSPNTRPLRLSQSVRFTNLWGAGHTLTANYLFSPQRWHETEVVSGSYNAPILGSPWSLVLFGYRSNSNIAALGGSQVLGNGYQVGVRAIYRLPAEKSDQTFSFGVDYKDFKQNITVDGALASQAPIRYLPLSLAYSFNRAGEKSELDFSVSGTLGLRVIKHLSCADPTAKTCTIDGSEDQFGLKDFKARENFAHLNIDASYMHVLADDVSATLRLATQYADSHLVTNEQFAIGGESTVRGYYMSEGVGDRGFAASLELAGPSLADHLPDFVGEFRPFTFIDGGIVSVIDPLKDQAATASLLGVGGGLRWRLFKHLKGSVTVGVPLESRNDTKAGDARVTFSAKGEF